MIARRKQVKDKEGASIPSDIIREEYNHNTLMYKTQKCSKKTVEIITYVSYNYVYMCLSP